MTTAQRFSGHFPDVVARKNGARLLVLPVMARRAVREDVKTNSPKSEERSVVVVARERTMRSRVVRLLTDADIKVAARAASIDTVLGLCAAEPGAVVLICCEDTEAPLMLRTLKRAAPQGQTVLVTLSDAAGRVLRSALRTQVDAVVYSSQLDQGLLPAVRAVFAELVVYPRTERRSLETPALSHREREVLRLAVRGCTNDEIGSRLYLATSTVKSHLTSAFSKLAVRSRSEAAALIFDPEEPAGRAILAELQDDQQAVTPR